MARVPHTACSAALILSLLLVCLLALSIPPACALTDEELAAGLAQSRGLPLGERIAFWASRFIGTPYDTDPLGQYVRRNVIVADDKVDCMYLVFRSVELARATSPEEAVEAALDMRFHGRGVLKDGKVVNYEDRFRYGEDMVRSAKWGRDVTASLGKPFSVKDKKNASPISALSPGELLSRLHLLRDGDILFLIKPPRQRRGDELVGHLGIVSRGKGTGEDAVYIIHASGLKGKRGVVKKEPLDHYLRAVRFSGVAVTRFE